MKGVVAVLFLAAVLSAQCQDILQSPPKDDSTITWVGCAADDSNYATMNIKDDKSKLDVDYTAFTDMAINPCEGELILQFGQQVTFGEDGGAIAREGAIRLNPDSDGAEDLEFRKNGQWVSLTSYVADTESKVTPGEAILQRNQRLFDLKTRGAVLPTDDLNSVPMRTVPSTGEEVTVLHGETLFFCDIDVDTNCTNSRTISVECLVADVDIDSAGFPLFTCSQNTIFDEILNGTQIMYYQCRDPLCASITEIVVNTPAGDDAGLDFVTIQSHALSVTLPGNVTHSFFYDARGMLFRYSSFENAFYVVQNSTELDRSGLSLFPIDPSASYNPTPAEPVIPVFDIVRNETSGAAVDDYYLISVVPVYSNGTNSTIPAQIASFNEAVWKVLVSRCSQASGCPDEEFNENHRYVPNGVADGLLLGAKDLSTGVYSHRPMAIGGCIVNDGGLDRLFFVVATRRTSQFAPPRELNQAVVSLVSFLCNDPLCTTYTTSLIADSNDFFDTNQVSGENGLESSITIRVELSEETGLPVVAVTTLTSAAFVISCHDAECGTAEYTTLSERLTSRLHDLEGQSVFEYFPDEYSNGHKRSVENHNHKRFDAYRNQNHDAFPIALHAGNASISIIRIGMADAEVDDVEDYYDIDNFRSGKRHTRVLQFAGPVVAPDGRTPCSAATVGRFLNGEGEVFGCTRLPRKPLENNRDLANAVISATELYQWARLGGSLHNLFSAHTLANENLFDAGAVFNPVVAYDGLFF